MIFMRRGKLILKCPPLAKIHYIKVFEISVFEFVFHFLFVIFRKYLKFFQNIFTLLKEKFRILKKQDLKDLFENSYLILLSSKVHFI